MLWKFGAAVVAAGLVTVAAASVAQAVDYVDSKAGFRVTIPEGWAKDTSDDDLVVTSPNTKTTFGFCWVHKVALPGTERVSQAEIDRRLAGRFTESYWRTQFEGNWKNVVVESSGEEVQNGRIAHFAIVTYKERRAHRVKTVVHTLPGRQYHLTCNAYLEAYAREQAAFETFFDSFVPIDAVAKD
jgi:hypothetical protein